MRAVVFNPQEVAPVFSEWTSPVAGHGEVVIRVRAAALNHRDLNITRRGNNHPFVYGSDVAGVIEAIGTGVIDLQVGDEVIVNTFITCGRCKYCVSGQEARCEQDYLLGGPMWPGSFAERVRVPAVNVVKKPQHLSFVEAAALPMAFGTAWHAVVSKARLQAGETILIQGIGGGVALAAMQIALALGARVIVTSSSDEKLRKAIQLGATAGIHYRREDVAARVKELTNGEGAHVSLSSSGHESVGIAIEAGATGGRIAQYAYLGSNLPSFDVDTVMYKQLSLFGSTLSINPEFEQAINLVNEHHIVPVVSTVLPFENALDAFQHMRDGVQFGKIVIEMRS